MIVKVAILCVQYMLFLGGNYKRMKNSIIYLTWPLLLLILL